MTLPRIRLRLDGRADVSFGYDAEVIAALKSGIPPRKRAWHPGERHWTVHADYVEFAIDVLGQRFGAVTVDDAALPSPEPRGAA